MINDTVACNGYGNCTEEGQYIINIYIIDVNVLMDGLLDQGVIVIHVTVIIMDQTVTNVQDY